MGAGKALALIGAVVALITLALSFVVPNFFGWYRVEASMLGMTAGVYFTGLGTLVSVPAGFTGGMEIFVLIGGILLIVGAIACIIGGVKESKAAGIIGGFLILLSPLILIINLLIGTGEFAAMIQLLGGPAGASVLWGSITIPGPMTLTWGIWIGSFLSLGAGVLGLIGGATV